MPTNVKEMMAAANAAVPKVTMAEAKRMMAEENALVVDVRDGIEGLVGPDEREHLFQVPVRNSLDHRHFSHRDERVSEPARKSVRRAA